MTVSARESVLMVATLAAALIGGSVMLLRPRYDQWGATRLAQEQTREEMVRYRDLIGQEAEWSKQFSDLRAWLPQFPADKNMTTYWLSEMDRAATSSQLTIGRSEARPEQRNGDIFELPIECRDWKGSLDGLVRFLYDLQSEGAMLDIRQLFVKPTPDHELRGSFTLYCAYTRGDTAAQARASGSSSK